MYKLFLSYSKPINKQQITILNYIKRTLNKLNICIVEVQNEVLDKSPIFKINNALKQCDFFLCIAYEKDQYMDQNGEYYYPTKSPPFHVPYTPKQNFIYKGDHP